MGTITEAFRTGIINSLLGSGTFSGIEANLGMGNATRFSVLGRPVYSSTRTPSTLTTSGRVNQTGATDKIFSFHERITGNPNSRTFSLAFNTVSNSPNVRHYDPDLSGDKINNFFILFPLWANMGTDAPFTITVEMIDDNGTDKWIGTAENVRFSSVDRIYQIPMRISRVGNPTRNTWSDTAKITFTCSELINHNIDFRFDRLLLLNYLSESPVTPAVENLLYVGLNASNDEPDITPIKTKLADGVRFDYGAAENTIMGLPIKDAALKDGTGTLLTENNFLSVPSRNEDFLVTEAIKLEVV